MKPDSRLPEVDIRLGAFGDSHYQGANDPEALNLFYVMADRHAERHKPDWMRSSSRRLIWGQDPLALTVLSVLSIVGVICVKGLFNPAVIPTPAQPVLNHQQEVQHDL